MKIVLFTTYMLLITCVFSQSTVDSLLNLYNTETDINRQIDLLDELVVEAYNFSIDSSIFYNKIAVELSIKTDNYQLIIGQIRDLAKLYIYNSDYSKALETYQSALPFAELSDNDTLKGLVIHSIGNAYLYDSEFDLALEKYLEALDIRERINDTIGIAASTNNIGLIYWKLEQYDLALKYYNLSLISELSIKNNKGIASSYNNIGMVYWKINQIDSAIYYVRKSLKIKLDYNIDKRSLTDAYNNLGVLYRNLSVFDTALIYFNKCLILDKNNQDKHDIANSYTNIATTHSYLNNNTKALVFLDSAETISLPTKDYEILINIYDLRANIYAEKNDFFNAYKSLRKHIQYKDSVYSENITNQIAEMQTKYDTEKKEHEIEMQKQEILVQNLAIEQQNTKLSLQRRILFGFTGFSVAIIVLLIFLTRLFFQKKKANNLLKQKNIEILQQNEEIETQANNLNEAFEKIRDANEVLSLKNKQIEKQKNLLKEKNDFVESSIKYASTIQNASLPLKTEIDKYFDNFIIFLPKDIVSGDFYFFSTLKQLTHKDYFFIVADCTGHGVPGAFMSMIGIRLLNKYVNEYKIKSPAKILENINKDIFVSLKQYSGNNRDGMDMIICKFSKKDGSKFVEVSYAGAKRALYYFDNKKTEIQKVDATRKSIGGAENNNLKFSDNLLTLSTETKFYLFTDGLPDQNNVERKRFGTLRVLNILTQNIEKPLEEQSLSILLNLEKWQNLTTQRDDITMIGLKFKS
ncbi:MAG: tetratricopeptide repeat protein [Bacteroidales bacterium]|nr:tetratricopeptide repeat protein [Bacteroidales bacterium]